MIIAMLILAWIQSKTDYNKSATVYASILTIISLVFDMIFGSLSFDSPVLLVMSMAFAWIIAWVYFHLLEHFSESMIVWLLIWVGFPIFLYVFPMVLMAGAASSMME